MSTTDDNKTKKPLGLSRPGKLELNKTVEAGKVKQSFSHGRSKMVTVEVKKKRTFAKNADGRLSEVKKEQPELIAEPAPTPVKQEEAPAKEADKAASHLTENEKAVRARALQEAKIRDEEIRAAEKKAKAEAALRAKEDEERARKEAEAAKNKAEEDATAAAEPKSQPAPEPTPEAEPEPEAPVEAAVPPPVKDKPAKAAPKPKDDIEGKKKVKVEQPKKVPAGKRDDNRRRKGKLTISEALSGETGERKGRSEAARQRARAKKKMQLQQQIHPSDAKQKARDVIIPETITVQELANRMAERGAAVVKCLMKLGVMATITQSIDADTAELVVEEFGHKVKRVSDADIEIGLKTVDDDPSLLEARPPVVTIMGHVDHGKTSLLDALRETDVAGGEAGGITQHIGAYQVTLESGAKISFVDTPGHAAFTDMRARGAKVTDIVVLVVAGDDGIMPQTIEAIHHAKAAEVPIIVAINKMDKPEADATRVRTELLQHELVVEEMGGDVLAVEVSAKSKLNLDKLEEAILLQAELLDLKANPNCPAEGVVVESKMEKGRGSVATVLVQRGTLRKGDIFVAGSEWGRVRAMVDAHGLTMDEAGPAMPVEVLGLNGSPLAGDEVTVVDNENRAREVSEYRQRKDRDAKAAASARGTLEQMFESIKDGVAKELPVVIKGDVHGSVEAITSALDKMATEEVKVTVLHSGVGGINESDVTLARASNAVIIGFNVRANPQARELAKKDNVEIRYYSIIYDVTDDMKKFLSGMMAPTLREALLGYAEIREVFSVSKIGKVAGCMVTEGMVKRGAKVRLLRDDVVVHEGALSQLKRFKDDVKEVKEGYECGMSFENYNDIQKGDFIECYDVEEVAREL